MTAPDRLHETRCLVFTDGATGKPLANTADISEVLKDHGTFVWLDLAQPGAAELALLQEEFALHPLAIEDAALSHERPKIDVYENYAMLVVQGAMIAADRLSISEMAIFAGKNFLVTIRSAPLWPLDEIEKRWNSHWGPIPRDAMGLLYVILDTVVDAYYGVTHVFDARVEHLENHLFEKDRGSDVILREIFTLKRDLQAFRRAAAPMRDILTHLMRGDVGLIEPSVMTYYRDVYDHSLRVMDQIEAQRDLVNGTLDIHLSAQAQRQGEINKQLTIIATIFLPLTYITGFFGQNFGFMVNSVASPQTFWWLGVGSQIAAFVALIAYFRIKRWY